MSTGPRSLADRAAGGTTARLCVSLIAATPLVDRPERFRSCPPVTNTSRPTRFARCSRRGCSLGAGLPRGETARVSQLLAGHQRRSMRAVRALPRRPLARRSWSRRRGPETRRAARAVGSLAPYGPRRLQPSRRRGQPDSQAASAPSRRSSPDHARHCRASSSPRPAICPLPARPVTDAPSLGRSHADTTACE